MIHANKPKENFNPDWPGRNIFKAFERWPLWNLAQREVN